MLGVLLACCCLAGPYEVVLEERVVQGHADQYLVFLCENGSQRYIGAIWPRSYHGWMDLVLPPPDWEMWWYAGSPNGRYKRAETAREAIWMLIQDDRERFP